jgi:hypothetical protein
MNIVVVAISGSRCVGKDTMFTILKTLNSKFHRFAFADMLKHDLNDFIKKQFDIDVFHPSTVEKELIRPLLICYGTIRRNQNTNYWVEKILSSLDNPAIIPCIVDLRFLNELDLLRETCGENLVHIHLERINSPIPTADELENGPILASRSDYKLTWGDDTQETRFKIVNQLYENIIEPKLVQ